MDILLIENVTDLRWDNNEQTAFTALVKFKDVSVGVPFSASLDDLAAHGRELFERGRDGEFGPIGAYEPPPIEEQRERTQPLSARQLRLGLLADGISPSIVSATIGAMPAGPDKDKAQIEWEYATTFNRMHPLIATVGAALGLSDQQIDTMWTAAAGL